MNTWGTGLFDNDGAQRLLTELRQLPGPRVGDRVDAALRGVFEPDTPHLPADTVAAAVAAVALLVSRVDPEVLAGLPDADEVAAWWDRGGIRLTPALKQAATATLNRALVRDDNDWYEQWVTAGDDQAAALDAAAHLADLVAGQD